MVRISGIAPQTKKKRRRVFVGVNALLWVIAVSAFAYTAEEMREAKSLYASLELEAALLVDSCQRAGAFLHAKLGFVFATAAFVFTLLPFLFGVRSRILGLLYMVAALAVLLLTAGAWFFHENTISIMPTQLSTAPR